MLNDNRVKIIYFEIIRRFFNLLDRVIAEYYIKNKNIYNFNKKGVFIDIVLAVKVISKVKDKYRFKTQLDNRKLIIIIKCINS